MVCDDSYPSYKIVQVEFLQLMQYSKCFSFNIAAFFSVLDWFLLPNAIDLSIMLSGVSSQAKHMSCVTFCNPSASPIPDASVSMFSGLVLS